MSPLVERLLFVVLQQVGTPLPLGTVEVTAVRLDAMPRANHQVGTVSL